MHYLSFAFLLACSVFVASPALATEQNPHVVIAKEMMSKDFMGGYRENEDKPSLMNGYPITIEIVRDAIESARADGVDTRALEGRYVTWLHESLEKHARGHLLDFVLEYAFCRGSFLGTGISAESAESMLRPGINEVHQIEDMMLVSGVALHRISEFRRQRDHVFDRMRGRARQTYEEGSYCQSPLKY